MFRGRVYYFIRIVNIYRLTVFVVVQVANELSIHQFIATDFEITLQLDDSPFGETVSSLAAIRDS